MTGKKQMFFGTPNDFHKLFSEIEMKHKLVYVQTGNFLLKDIKPMESMLTLNLGRTEYDSAWYPAYLVFRGKANVGRKRVPATDEWAVYLDFTNKKAVSISLGGIFKEGILIAGELNRNSDDEEAIELFKIFQNTLRRQFSRVSPHLVGKEAEQLLDSGWRLCWHAKAEKLNDLKRMRPKIE